MAFFTMLIVGLILAAVSFVVSEALKPDPEIEEARPSNIGDFQFPTAENGRVVPIIWGTAKIRGPNVVWYGDFRQVPLTDSIRVSIFKKKTITTGFQYFFGIQMALCHGPGVTLVDTYIGDKKLPTPTGQITDPEFFGGSEFGEGGIDGFVSFHDGNFLQTMNGYLATKQAVSVPLRGTAHVVFEGGYIGDTTRIKPWSFVVRRIPDGLGLGASATIAGNDANPANVLYEILTDTDWGLGLPAADIDTTSFTTAGTTLATEGNGFSFQLERAMEVGELLDEIQRQIDGLVVLNGVTGKFELRLIRGGYDVDLIPQVNDTNLLRIDSFTPATWDETINQYRVNFADRAKDYKNDWAQAHDLGNERTQGFLVPASETYPGVKDRTNANNIATRELRGRSRPLKKARLVVDRTMYALLPGDVFAFTNADLDQTKLPMRVTRVDKGELVAGEIAIDSVEDVFSFETGIFGEPQDTLWDEIENDVGGIPSADQQVFEAPRKFGDIDVETPGVHDRIYCAAREQFEGAVAYKIYRRSASGTPSGAYTEDSQNYGFIEIGEVRTALDVGDQDGTATLEINPTPSAIARIEALFENGPSEPDMGQSLVNLIRVGEEFMTVTSVTNNTTWLALNSVYRGLMDTVPELHAVNTKVYVLAGTTTAGGGGLTAATFNRSYNVDIQLRPVSRTDQATEGESTTISLTMDDRWRRPLPPAQMVLNGTLYDDPVDFDTQRPSTSGLDNRGIDVTYFRRDFRQTDEIEGLNADAAALFTDFPAANTTIYRGEIIEDPDGSPTSLFTVDYADTANIFFSRTSILRQLAGVIPSTLQVKIRARHDLASETLDARDDLQFIFDLDTSTLDNDQNFGNLAQNVISATYAAPDTGSYGFEIGTAFATGVVEARINGGSFSTVIAATNTTGTLAGVTATDTIEVRHTDPGSGLETFLQITPPTSTAGAYAIFI